MGKPSAGSYQPSAGLIALAALLGLTIPAAGCGESSSTADVPTGGHDARGPGVVYTTPDEGGRDGTYVPPDTGTPDAGFDSGWTDDSGADAGIDAGTPEDGGPDDAETPDAAGGDAAADDTGSDAGQNEDTGAHDGGTPTGRIVLNEVLNIPRNGDPLFGQYVEILNDTDDWVDIDKWTLKADQAFFVFSKDSGDTEIPPRETLVVGGSDDEAKNSYAPVAYVWPAAFKLPAGSCALRLQDVAGSTVDAVAWNASFPIVEGSAMERKHPSLDGNAAGSWQRAPSLITFLDETGGFTGDRGSPGRANYEIKTGANLPIGTTGVSSRIESPQELWRWPADVKARDIMEFVADVDGVSGDLWAFLSLLDAGGGIVWKDIAYSQEQRDFRIELVVEADGALAAQVQADFAYSFDPADFTAKALVADKLDLGIPSNRLSIKTGDKYAITGAKALFTADADAEPWPLAPDKLAYSSTNPQVAPVDANGVISGLRAGGTAVTVKYKGGTADLPVVLAVAVEDLPANDACSAAVDVSQAATVTGSTNFAADDYNPTGCLAAFYTGPDLVYSFSSPTAATWRFTASPFFDYNPMLYVFDSCPPAGNCVDGTRFSGKGEPEILEFDAQPNRTYYLIVDGDLTAGEDRGAFTLKVEKN